MWCGIGLGVFSLSFILEFPRAWGQPHEEVGIQPLIPLDHRFLQKEIPPFYRCLCFPSDQEQFLEKLERTPPSWDLLTHPDQGIQSERLFQFNRQRDQKRLKDPTRLTQPLAFQWSGILREYIPEYQGFSLALGPQISSTSWGLVRFKPNQLPNFIIALPSPTLATQLLARQQEGEKIEVIVVFMGTLVPDESIVYAFTHEEPQTGIIMPVVQIERMLYFLPTDPTRLPTSWHES